MIGTDFIYFLFSFFYVLYSSLFSNKIACVNAFCFVCFFAVNMACVVLSVRNTFIF